MVWNHWEHRNEPSTRLEGMLPDPTANLGYAIQSLSSMGDAKIGLTELQNASGNAYGEEVRNEIDRRTMMRIEQDFKKWLAGSLEGANIKSDAPDADKRYQRPCKVMNIKNRGDAGFMDPYVLAERNHTNWGNADLMSLPGVAEYIKENDRKETESKLSDALLHDPSSGRLKDLSSAWEYFIKFVVQQPDIFAAGIDFKDSTFPSDDFHPGNWGPRFETSVMPGTNQRFARNSFTDASGTASSTRDPQPDLSRPTQGPFGQSPAPTGPTDADGTMDTPAAPANTARFGGVPESAANLFGPEDAAEREVLLAEGRREAAQADFQEELGRTPLGSDRERVEEAARIRNEWLSTPEGAPLATPATLSTPQTAPPNGVGAFGDVGAVLRSWSDAGVALASSADLRERNRLSSMSMAREPANFTGDLYPEGRFLEERSYVGADTPIGSGADSSYEPYEPPSLEQMRLASPTLNNAQLLARRELRIQAARRRSDVPSGGGSNRRTNRRSPYGLRPRA